MPKTVGGGLKTLTAGPLLPPNTLSKTTPPPQQVLHKHGCHLQLFAEARTPPETVPRRSHVIQDCFQRHVCHPTLFPRQRMPPTTVSNTTYATQHCLQRHVCHQKRSQGLLCHLKRQCLGVSVSGSTVRSRALNFTISVLVRQRRQGV